VFFRESSFLKMLPALLPAAEADMAEQKALNVVAVLGVLRLTVAATLPAVERATNQSVPIWIPTTRFKSLLSSRSPLKSDWEALNCIRRSVLLAHGALERLLPLAVGRSATPTLRVAAEALAALGDTVAAHAGNQAALAAATVRWGSR
jgi:hypothetical protein